MVKTSSRKNMNIFSLVSILMFIAGLLMIIKPFGLFKLIEGATYYGIALISLGVLLFFGAWLGFLVYLITAIIMALQTSH